MNRKILVIYESFETKKSKNIQLKNIKKKFKEQNLI